jgi:hypothetical protein
VGPSADELQGFLRPRRRLRDDLDQRHEAVCSGGAGLRGCIVPAGSVIGRLGSPVGRGTAAGKGLARDERLVPHNLRC